ncbi:hypothetical protein [Actinomadura macra]|uniref:hypothetical protein n=1 Tax=Actinomadura macra TaxID=46164 RepID=UPI00083529CD|nr:hypothetical protein [Actinomadura macra]
MAWEFGTIDNRYNEQAMIDYQVPKETQTQGSKLNETRGNATIEVSTLGAIMLTEDADRKQVQVRWTSAAFPSDWTYDDENHRMDITINTDGSFEITGGTGDPIKGKFDT